MSELDLSTEVEVSNYPKELQPHLHMRLEVLSRAIYDAAGYTCDIQHHSRERQQSERENAKMCALNWLGSNNRGDFTLSDICEALGLTCAHVRAVAKLVQDGQIGTNPGRVGDNLLRLFG